MLTFLGKFLKVRFSIRFRDILDFISHFERSLDGSMVIGKTSLISLIVLSSCFVGVELIRAHVQVSVLGLNGCSLFREEAELDEL